MTQSKRISIIDYCNEISNDLDELIKEFPYGISVSNLHEYYGESIARTMRAIHILSNQSLVTIHQSTTKAYYIVPTGFKFTVPFPELTELQRKLALYILQLCHKANTNRIQTDFSQLSRIMDCSYGGLRACIKRLTMLGYISLNSPSLRGKQTEMVIAMGKKLVDYKLPVEKVDSPQV